MYLGAFSDDDNICDINNTYLFIDYRLFRVACMWYVIFYDLAFSYAS